MESNRQCFFDDSYLFADDPTRQKIFQQWAFQRLLPLMQQLGWQAQENEAEQLANTRAAMISVLGGMGEPSVLAEARRRFAVMDSDASAAPAALRLLILAIVAEHADSATWDRSCMKKPKQKNRHW